MTLKKYEEEIVMKEYSRIMHEIAGSKVLGITVDLNDDRLVMIAAFYLGLQKGKELVENIK